MANFPTMTIIDIIMIAIGIYMIYVAAWMKRNHRPHDVVLAKDEIKKCRDLKGFAEYMYEKVLAFGIVLMLCGATAIVSEYLLADSIWLSWVMLAVFLAVFSYFTYHYRKAREKYIRL